MYTVEVVISNKTELRAEGTGGGGWGGEGVIEELFSDSIPLNLLSL